MDIGLGAKETKNRHVTKSSENSVSSGPDYNLLGLSMQRFRCLNFYG